MKNKFIKDQWLIIKWGDGDTDFVKFLSYKSKEIIEVENIFRIGNTKYSDYVDKSVFELDIEDSQRTIKVATKMDLAIVNKYHKLKLKQHSPKSPTLTIKKLTRTRAGKEYHTFQFSVKGKIVNHQFDTEQSRDKYLTRFIKYIQDGDFKIVKG